jgi:hypothetical protein
MNVHANVHEGYECIFANDLLFKFKSKIFIYFKQKLLKVDNKTTNENLNLHLNLSNQCHAAHSNSSSAFNTIRDDLNKLRNLNPNPSLSNVIQSLTFNIEHNLTNLIETNSGLMNKIHHSSINSLITTSGSSTSLSSSSGGGISGSISGDSSSANSPTLSSNTITKESFTNENSNNQNNESNVKKIISRLLSQSNNVQQQQQQQQQQAISTNNQNQTKVDINRLTAQFEQQQQQTTTKPQQLTTSQSSNTLLTLSSNLSSGVSSAINSSSSIGEQKSLPSATSTAFSLPCTKCVYYLDKCSTPYMTTIPKK